MASKTSKRIKTPERQLDRLARRLLPKSQADRGGLVLVDVSNHSDADQRHMMRSDEKHTVRKLTRIDKLLRAGIIERHEAQACEWYAEAHALGYETLGITANYGDGGGGGCTAYTHLARYKAQQEARADYLFAREAMPAFLLNVLDAVAINGDPIGLRAKGRQHFRNEAMFRLAANLLHQRIAHMLPVG